MSVATGSPVHFKCVGCGACCRNHRLPLTVGEAIAWLDDGHPVQILCDALPWTTEPPPDDLGAAHRRRRSFATTSGDLPIRVTAILVADLGLACPYLQPDQRCANHSHRPLVCRIYPADINPFVEFATANKSCPPEAWDAAHPLLRANGVVVDGDTTRDIHASRATDAEEVEIKARLCVALGIRHAALANEGFTVHRPGTAQLREALALAASAGSREVAHGDWDFISNRATTVAALKSIAVSCGLHRTGEDPGFEYLAFHPALPLAGGN